MNTVFASRAALRRRSRCLEHPPGVQRFGLVDPLPAGLYEMPHKTNGISNRLDSTSPILCSFSIDDFCSRSRPLLLTAEIKFVRSPNNDGLRSLRAATSGCDASGMWLFLCFLLSVMPQLTRFSLTVIVLLSVIVRQMMQLTC